MKYNKLAPEVNAGSMADIAFLLLIFFLVTTSIENDAGLKQILSTKDLQNTPVNIKQRNLLEIVINSENKLMAEREIIPLNQLRKEVVAFLDNGGIKKGAQGFCDYCQGERTEHLSENPKKAIISLRMSRNSDYPFYVAVQNEITGAYNFLRNRESQKMFGLDYTALVVLYNESDIPTQDKVMARKKIELLRAKYPKKLVELEMMQP